MANKQKDFSNAIQRRLTGGKPAQETAHRMNKGFVEKLFKAHAPKKPASQMQRLNNFKGFG